ncbi:purine-cytosine permease family protein [Paraburkholderia lycopersici]|uniref:Purine-cytosine permease n=1 Tax=Paraburkholderia lycopersici TaxID=416944 RepID=A0A1G6QTU7_9BURK|nr:allantoin permease [Paraburkholderia lycopersici]SDC95713.1 Purine-cytosine permease [Paraburkholderia lycopersici]
MELKDDADKQDSSYAASPVPDGARMSRGSLTMAWWAICSAMFWLVVSATLAIHFGTVNALIGLALSVAVYSVINRVIVRFAISSGLSVALFSRVVFGSYGAPLATLIFFATAIYYALFEGSVIAIAINAYFPAVSLHVAYLIVVTYSVLLVFGSVQRWLDRFNGVLLPFYLIGLIAALIAAFTTSGDHSAWLHLGPPGGAPANGWWNCFTAFMGVWILMMYTWDYARFGKKQDAGYHANLNFGWLFYTFTFLCNGVAGIFLAGTLATEGAVSEVSVVMALLKLMGFGGLLFVWVTQTRINTANFYLASTNMHAFFQSAIGLDLPKFVWSIVVGALVYVLMLTNVFGFILQALSYQGIFVVAWVAIAVTHIVSPHYDEIFGGQIEYRRERVVALNRCGLLAWLAATAIGIALLECGGGVATFSAPAAAISAALVYRAALSLAGKRSFVRDVAL